MEKIINGIKEKAILILKQPITYILIFCIFVQVLMYNTIPDYIVANDSITYTEQYMGSISKGQVDSARTPVYPYLAKIIKYVGGEENWFHNIVLFQKILFIGTLLLFYFTLNKLVKNKIIVSLITIIFGICPSIVFWNVEILTESVSLFEMALLCYLTVTYLKKPSNIIAGSMRNINIYYDND